MLKPQKHPDIHLMSKKVNILATNVCNLDCGGCHQLCGYVPKDKLFFVELDDLEFMVDHIINNSQLNQIGIFGGEPTLHPQYDEMIDMLSRKNCLFEIYTNGRTLPHIDARYSTHKTDYENIVMLVDPKKEKLSFLATWVASKDVFKKDDPYWYWDNLVQKHCHMWKNCRTVLWNRHAYACEVFATLDILSGENHGWPMIEGENVFEKTPAEVREQASHFCYRCGWCVPKAEHQTIDTPTKISETNRDLNIKHEKTQSVQLVQLKI